MMDATPLTAAEELQLFWKMIKGEPTPGYRQIPAPGVRGTLGGKIWVRVQADPPGTSPGDDYGDPFEYPTTGINDRYPSPYPSTPIDSNDGYPSPDPYSRTSDGDGSAYPPPSLPPYTSLKSPAEQLEAVTVLLNGGYINRAEFERLKANILRGV